MAFEKYYTRFSTTVGVSGYVAGAGALNVASTSGVSANFSILIVDSTSGTFKALLKVTGINSGTQFATTTEPGGTDANCSSGDLVYAIVSAASMDRMRLDIHQRGTRGSAVSDRAGNLYLPTDACTLMRDNGSIFDTYGPVWGLGDPSAFSWTQANFGSCVQDSTHGGLAIDNPTSEGSFQIRALVKSVPATPWHIEFGYVQCPALAQASNEMSGPCLSDGTKFTIYTSMFQGTRDRCVEFYCTNFTTWGGTIPINAGFTSVGTMVWMRLGDDGTTNRTVDLSCDGYTWYQISSESRTAGLTASQVGIYVNGGPQGIRLFHYKETA